MQQQVQVMGPFNGKHHTSDDEALLLGATASADELVYAKKKVKWVWILILKIVMWLIFIPWLAIIILYPLNAVPAWFESTSYYTSGTFLGVEGIVFLIFSSPILIIAFLSVAYLIISGKDHPQKKKTSSKHPSYRLSTFPLFVNGPFGVISAAESIGILLFLSYVIWTFSAYVGFKAELSADEESSFLLVSGHCLALTGIYCLAFLFLPVARGSIILRLIDIPFGHAARYHIWLGHLTMFIFTLHALCYIIAWYLDGTLLQEILDWPESGVTYLAGAIGLVAGLLMWITSLPPMRKKYFEVFFYTHQLYIIFIIFFVCHVGVVTFSKVAGTIFLFMLDRFLRFCQSRNTVDIVSATCFPGGIVRLILSKPKNLQCNALSFIFLRVREVSRLQWHPFSVSVAGEHHLSVLIKAVGGWTTKIKQNITYADSGGPQHQEGLLDLQPHSNIITASVEGPYGHELPHHLKYENLILVAGGVGISPFLAVMNDVIEQGKPFLSKNLLLVWAVKRSNELSLISMVDIKSFCPNLDILIYITQESEPHWQEEGTPYKAINSFVSPASKVSSISLLVGTGNNMWFGIYLITTTAGFAFLICLLHIFYVNPYNLPIGWYRGLLFLACMVASVLIFGGFVVGLWYLWGRKFSKMDYYEDGDLKSIETAHKDLCEDLGSSTKIRYGARPDFEDIFESVSENWGHVDVGLIVCGPPSLESSVAKECRSLNMRRQYHHPIFHFHSHNFNL